MTELTEINMFLSEGLALLKEMRRGSHDGNCTIDWTDDKGNEWSLDISYIVTIDQHYGSDRDGRRGTLDIQLDDWSVDDAGLTSGEDEGIKFDRHKLSQTEKRSLQSAIYREAVKKEFF